MNNMSILLYILGLIGLIISIILVIINSKKNKKIISFICFLLIISSIGSLGSGVYLFITNKASTKNTSSTDNSVDNNLKSSYDDLSFIYDLNTKSSLKVKEACITIENKSDELFSGNVPIKLLDENNKELSTYTIPVKNLIPNESTEFKVQADSNTNSITYSFDGTFSKYNPKDKISSYVVSNLGIGKGFFRFEVITDNNSPENLKKICKEFKEKYNKSLCNGFLIYFISNPEDNFTKSYADYYQNNTSDKNLLTIYDDISTCVIE